MIAGVSSLAAGWALGALGICPVVKRIWTPSFVLWSGGFCLLFTAFFYELVDVRHRQRSTFPLVVLGMNSIAAYCLHEALIDPIAQALVRHLPGVLFHVLGPAFDRILVGAAALAVIWMILLWMHHRRIFVKI